MNAGTATTPEETKREVAPIPRLSGAALAKIVVRGDLSDLNPNELAAYYLDFCRALELNPLAKPFDLIWMDSEEKDEQGNRRKKLILYANRNCTDQLRSKHRVSVTKTESEEKHGCLIVRAFGTDEHGRPDAATGVVPMKKQDGDWQTTKSGKRYFQPNGKLIDLGPTELANAIMKAETKAKRRLTLSLIGLGIPDESEIEDIPGAIVAPVMEVLDGGEPGLSIGAPQQLGPETRAAEDGNGKKKALDITDFTPSVLAKFVRAGNDLTEASLAPGEKLEAAIFANRSLELRRTWSKQVLEGRTPETDADMEAVTTKMLAEAIRLRNRPTNGNKDGAPATEPAEKQLAL